MEAEVVEKDGYEAPYVIRVGGCLIPEVPASNIGQVLAQVKAKNTASNMAPFADRLVWLYM